MSRTVERDGAGGNRRAPVEGEAARRAGATSARLRRAGPADAETLSRLGAETFTITFGHLYPAEDLEAFLSQTHALPMVAKELADPAMASWLAEAEGVAVGYATVGPCKLPHPEVTPACGELMRLYVLPAWQGEGVAATLFAEALAWLRAHCAGKLWIGVWSENARALRFYERAGFEVVGGYQFEVGRCRDEEVIMRER